MIECEVCDRDFVNWHAARQHMNALGHWGCDRCTQTFWDEQDAEYHMDDYGHHAPVFECEACPDEFDSPQDARIHMDAFNHWRTHWCESCEKGFQNENNLRMHLNSKIHRGTTLTCPFCKRHFTTATGLTAHIETGSCPNARDLNHATLLKQIRRRDRNHVITKKLLTYPSSTPTTTTVTSACWNGDGYECYICHRDFSSLHGLHQHVNSPAHRQAAYHCPGRNCVKEFTSLTALFNHLESEACGAVRFETVQHRMGHFLTGRKVITF